MGDRSRYSANYYSSQVANSACATAPSIFYSDGYIRSLLWKKQGHANSRLTSRTTGNRHIGHLLFLMCRRRLDYCSNSVLNSWAIPANLIRRLHSSVGPKRYSHVWGRPLLSATCRRITISDAAVIVGDSLASTS